MTAGTWEVLNEIGRALVRQHLFTVNACDLSRMEVARVYSTHPQAYPVGGRKAKRETAWGRQVMVEHRTFIGRTATDMAAAFDDHERMASLGVHAIVNVPVVAAGTCVAVLNFGLRAAPDEQQVAWAEKLARLA